VRCPGSSLRQAGFEQALSKEPEVMHRAGDSIKALLHGLFFCQRQFDTAAFYMHIAIIAAMEFMLCCFEPAILQRCQPKEP
jgi:hypothetical protein